MTKIYHYVRSHRSKGFVQLAMTPAYIPKHLIVLNLVAYDQIRVDMHLIQFQIRVSLQ